MGNMSSGSSLGHLRFEVEVAAVHAARRPDSEVAARRLEEAREALREEEAYERWALAGRYVRAAGERDEARTEWTRRVRPTTASPELASWAMSRHRAAAVVANVVRARLSRIDRGTGRGYDTQG